MFENDGSMSFYHDIEILDSCTLEHAHILRRDGMSIGTPTITDLDGDGILDLITTDTTGYSSAGCTILRWNLGIAPPNEISWGAYLGTDNDGYF